MESDFKNFIVMEPAGYWLIAAAVIGYLLGSLPFGYLVAKAKGVNIFEHGSKNPGSTNVGRVLGEKFGAQGKLLGRAVFVLDVLKGAAATGWPLFLRFLTMEQFRTRSALFSDDGRIYLFSPSEGFLIAEGGFYHICAVIGLIAALLGHSFSIFTKFRGGKGVATAAGGFLVLMPVPLLISATTWVVIFYASRYVSLASILASAALPVAAFFLGQPPLLTGLAAVIGAFVILRHRANIARLLNGTENRFVKKTGLPQSPPSA
jgi:glycerol-3-phosphate acyltransferase PlsY